MQKTLTIRLSPADAASESQVIQKIAGHLHIRATEISGYQVIKKSIDARGRQVMIQLSLKVFAGEPYQPDPKPNFVFQDVRKSNRSALIIGAGPAGLFAALMLLEKGIKPIILERGKDVRARRRDLAMLNKEGILNPESNYCFGEGGAGTYSDGKLYTRSTKRGDIQRILQLFVHFGASPNILFEAHPHIGTNKLPQIITAMRALIEDCGGECHFNQKLSELIISTDTITSVRTRSGDIFKADQVILATGHSARDIFHMLSGSGIRIEAKPFALGVRVEHPQSLIDSIQYHCPLRDPNLPPASYSLVRQVDQHGVFSFCMCPGGIIAPASTSQDELVVNGWSPSKRNNPFANSGMVVTVDELQASKFLKNEKINADNPLLFMYFQQKVEKMAFQAGGGRFQAPAQRLVDFAEKKYSSKLPDHSYLPGLTSAQLHEVLPSFIYASLAGGFRVFGKQMKGYFSNEAIVVATESRTSSPVRIPRDPETLQHPQIRNLYPCGEGAGYAGGIVSAAMDGERVALAIANLA
ncbi:MAG TPA: FAD-dependent monooxygenase [Ferruginibacter sp.]|nr:FAD-dependent monooxygenase [Ferruginibacter sp.]